jgi:RNA binding exosome subunit
VRVFAHATEDSGKVLAAARNLLPSEIVETIAFKKHTLLGHHGNPIILLEAKIEDKTFAESVFQKLSAGLSSLDKEILRNDLTQHLEHGNLYVRIDKQSAYLNQIKLGLTDPIHLRIHFKRQAPEEIIGICRNFGFLP